MIRRVVLKPDEIFDPALLNRSGAFDAQALIAATEIIEAVRQDGDEALARFTKKFDGVEVQQWQVTPEEIKEAAAKAAPETVSALEHAAHQIREFHERQKTQSWFFAREDGALIGAKVTPIDSAGVYVPGGRALYPSSLLMNAIPAQVAGVKRIVCATPPTGDGSVDPAIAAASLLAGVNEMYRVGGAQAIGALAYGTETIAPVDKITGPGNAFVAAAKKIVSGDVGIDMIAGPSEVCVVADATAHPQLVAIDLMAQAEHDPQARCYFVTTDEGLVDEVEEAIQKLLDESPRNVITRQSLKEKGLVVVCQSLKQAFEVVNEIAPEHLELHISDALSHLGSVHHAGAIFLGPWTPEAVGDYVAGPNHTLPTGGTARFASPLSLNEFVKSSSVLSFSPEALKNDAVAVMAIAKHEGLWAHRESVDLRLELLDRASKKPEVSGAEESSSHE